MDTGWLFFSTFTQDTSLGGVNWYEGDSTPLTPLVNFANSNMGVDDDNIGGAKYLGGAVPFTYNYMKFTNIPNLDTVLPQGCNILGMQAMMRRGDAAGGTTTYDNSLKLVKNGVITGVEHAEGVSAIWNTYGTDTTLWAGGYHYWGNSTDLWGGFTREDVDANFGLAFSMNCDAVSTYGTFQFIKVFGVKIYYDDEGMFMGG